MELRKTAWSPRDAALIDEPEQGVFLFARAKDHDRLAGQMLGGQLRGDSVDAAIVDVGSALLDDAPGLALAFGQAGFDQGIDDVQSAVGQPGTRQLAAGNIGKDLAQLGVGEFD